MPATSARSRTRSTDHPRDRSNRTSPATSKPPSPAQPVSSTAVAITPTATRPLSPHAWRADDVRALARAVYLARRSHPPPQLPFDSAAELPPALSRKGLGDVRRALSVVHDAHDRSNNSFAPRCDVHNVLASLSSDMAFLAAQGAERETAFATLFKARGERLATEGLRERLVKESKLLSDQIAKERALRAKAGERKAALEKVIEDVRKKVDSDRANFDILRQNLEKAQISELEVRRRLDRMRLKVAALRGEMVIPTLDKLRPSPRWLGDFGEGLSTVEAKPTLPEREVARAMAMNAALRAVGNEKGDDVVDDKCADNNNVADGDVVMDETKTAVEVAPGESSSKTDDLEVDLDAEGMEHRLLKNRLAMVETEKQDWQETLDAEKAKVELLSRTTAKLEVDCAWRRKLNGTVSYDMYKSMKAATADPRTSAKVRNAVKGIMSKSTAAANEVAKKTIRKGRKSRPPSRSLVSES